MNHSTHAVEKEELMAYLDGELPVARATAVAVHLEQCAECAALASELRALSQQLAAWQVEPSPARLAERVTAAFEESTKGPVSPKEEKVLFGMVPERRPRGRQWVLGLMGAVAGVILLFAIAVPNLLRSRIASNQAVQHARQATEGLSPESPTANQLPPYTPQQPTSPMIARRAGLALVTKEFDNSRAAIEAVVRQHQGYAAHLQATGQPGSGRSLQATFRVPAERLDAVLAEMKKLGRVEQESQGGEEVTQQYVDLGARLSNARHTEQRLIEVLRQRTGKVTDILAVEQEIARVRGEIERLQAQLKNLETQVRFATLQVRLSEEYKAQLEVAPRSTGTRLRNATVEGYRSAVESAVGLILFLLRYGPALLFWGVVLFWPARLAWRRLRT